MTLLRLLNLRFSILFLFAAATALHAQPTIFTTSLPYGGVGTLYGAGISSNAGPAATWSIVSGSLPPGLTLDLATGANAFIGGPAQQTGGIPTAGGVYTFTIKVHDPDLPSPDATQALSIGIEMITSTSPLPAGIKGAPYSFNFAAAYTPGPYTWFTTGTLPPGLSLSTSGSLTGTPTATGTFSFPVTAADDVNDTTTTANFSITINAPATVTVIAPPVLPNAFVGAPYKFDFAASGGSPPYTFTLAPGTVPPPGLGLNSNGSFGGVPTSPGTYAFSVIAIDSTKTSSAPLAVQLPISTGLTITTNSPLPGASVGSPYSVNIAASSGTPPYFFSLAAGTLPPGFMLSNNGTISGTATATGTFNFTIQVSDSSKSSSSKAFQLSVTTGINITAPSVLPNGVAGMPYSFTLTESGGQVPITWSLPPSAAGPNVPPPGLTLSPSGVLSGSPTTPGSYGFEVVVTDSNEVSSQPVFLQLTIAAPLSITSASPLPTATVGSAYSQTISVSGGNPPFTFSVLTGSLPPGIALSASGALTGAATTAGTYGFTIQATDKFQYTVSKAFQLFVAPAGSLLQVSPQALTFSATIGGDTPPPQAISITSPSGAPVAFMMIIDSGTPGAAPPSWLTVTPASGPAPARLTVTANQSTLQAGKYSAVIHISTQGGSSQTSDVSVTFNVSTAPPQITATPAALRFSAVASSPSAQEQSIVLSNQGGGGAQAFSAAVVSHSTWITSVTPASGRVGPNSPATVRVAINTQGLKPGNYHDILRILAGDKTIDVPVSVFISETGSVLGLTATGLRFELRAGAGSTQPQSVGVLDLGDPSSSISWKASVAGRLGAMQGLITVSPASGTALPGRPGALTITPGPAAAMLAAGAYYALVSVTDGTSTVYVVVVLDIASSTAPALPELSPAGLFFTSSTSAQTVFVFTSSTSAANFQTAAYTSDGNPWLSATPASGTASTAAPGKVSISVTPGTLAAGIYYGTVNVSMNGVERTVNVTLVVLAGPSPAAPALTPNAASCTPGKIALTETGLVNNFSVPAGWPATLIVQLNDDCGNTISNGSVVANFSNGDPPLSLRGDQSTNTYAATWQPGASQSQMTITIRATASALQPAVQQFTGGVNANTLAPPSLVPDGALHIFFNTAMAAALGGALAPGNVAQVYGSGLSPTATKTVVPLPPEFNGTFMLIGPAQAPLFYVSDNLLDVQVPSELAPNRQYQLIVSANGALSLPETIDLVPLQPGVAQFPDGTAIAQRPGDLSLVSASSPAKPGELLTIYLAGMGATNPPVASGQPTPLRLVLTTVQPLVTLDGQTVDYSYAGLTPTGVGLYQINFTVPENARTGTLDLVVTQNGVPANTTKLTVAR